MIQSISLKFGLFAGLILGLLVVCIPGYADSPRYVATATILVRPVQSSLLSGDRHLSENEYNRFVKTQVALLQLPTVIDKALENAEVAQLPIVLEQQDKRAWLTNELRVRAGNSELMYVSIKTNSAEASEKINNAVVDAYFNFIDEINRQTTSNLIRNLRLEEQRQRSLAQQLQENIRSKTRQAAVQGAATGPNISILAQGESLAKDTALAEARLTAIRAQRKGIVERIANPIRVPVSVLIQLNPELKALNEQREALVQQRKELSQAISRPDDPRIVQFDRLVEQIDERVKTIAFGIDNNALEALQNQFRLQEEVNLFQLDQEIRVQEILVEELIKKFNEQLLENVERAESVLDASFEQAQLERTHRTLDRIEDRILTITLEQRAPGQIVQMTRAVVSTVPRPAEE